MQHIVEILAAQAAVVLNNTLLMEQQKSLLRFEKELQIGQEIQTSFLPATLLQMEGWEFAACFYPAREVAGDFYDLFTIENDSKVAFVIADVCDKGVGSALFAALIRTLFRAFMKYNPPVANDLMEERALALELTNDYIFQNQIQTSMFATLFAGVLHPDTGVLKYVNCGHNPPYIVGTSGIKTKLKPTGPVVGAFPGVKYKVKEITLQPGESLFTFTDGLPEARDINHEFYTDDRILELLEQPNSSASNLLDRVDKSVHAHIASASQFDDITMLVIRRQSDLVDNSREE
jgi:sigma-B regulation protein RsbU (phosphoserine phosphatase)